MTAPNHITGGFTITGVISSIIGINILETVELIPIIILASLLPDIDHPKSILGRLFKPFSRFLNKKYGHRSITHSLVALVSLTAVISGFQSVYFPDLPISTVFALAYGGHLVLDMVTVQGCPLFYPFYKNSCVIPGNPHMRLRTGNMRHETMAFCIFVMFAFFMKPLFANGFWTTYNSLFGTLKHIVSEYHKSENLMIVDFEVQHGSEMTLHRGLCIEVSPSAITVLTPKKKFETYPKNGQQIKEIIPTHTKMSYSFEQGQFHDISIDSMHRLFRSGKFTKMEIQGSDQFYYVDNGINIKKRKLTLDYPNQLILREIPNDTIITKNVNPSIQLKLQDLNMYRTKQRVEMVEYKAALQEYQDKRDAVATEADEVQKEILMIEFGKMSAPTLPSGYLERIERLWLEIKGLREKDDLEYAEALEKGKGVSLSLSGSWEMVLVNGRYLR